MIEHYTSTSSELCALEFDEAASSAGKSEAGHCVEGESRAAPHNPVSDMDATLLDARHDRWE
jgi:hypothetical protein